MPNIPIQIHPTDVFYQSLDDVNDLLANSAGPNDIANCFPNGGRDPVEEFNASVGQALQTLKNYRWDDSIQLAGVEIRYDLGPCFSLLVQRRTDRDGHGHPVTVHLYLSLIELRREV